MFKEVKAYMLEAQDYRNEYTKLVDEVNSLESIRDSKRAMVYFYEFYRSCYGVGVLAGKVKDAADN